MSRRASGFSRVANELYETPEWVTKTLLANVRLSHKVVEPACGHGKISRVLLGRGHQVYSSDIVDWGWSGQDEESDFMTWANLPPGFDAVVANPPYGVGAAKIATAFLEKALALTKPVLGQVAMLLPAEFDHAKTRRCFFANCPAFAATIVLHARIRWFEGSTGSPSQNHCWFFWDWRHHGLSVKLYADNDNGET